MSTTPKFVKLNYLHGTTILPDDLIKFGEDVELFNGRIDGVIIEITGCGSIRPGERMHVYRDVEGTWLADKPYRKIEEPEAKTCKPPPSIKLIDVLNKSDVGAGLMREWSKK